MSNHLVRKMRTLKTFCERCVIVITHICRKIDVHSPEDNFPHFGVGAYKLAKYLLDCEIGSFSVREVNDHNIGYTFHIVQGVI